MGLCFFSSGRGSRLFNVKVSVTSGFFLAPLAGFSFSTTIDLFGLASYD